VLGCLSSERAAAFLPHLGGVEMKALLFGKLPAQAATK
jgi:hypothetical protein